MFRTQDAVRSAELLGQGTPAVDEADNRPYALKAPLGELLPQPHHHGWVVEDRDDLLRLEQQLSELWPTVAERHLGRWEELLRVADTSDLLDWPPAAPTVLDPGREPFTRAFLDRAFPGADPALTRPPFVRRLAPHDPCPWPRCLADDGGSRAEERTATLESTPSVRGRLDALRVPPSEAWRVVGLRIELLEELARALGAPEVLAVHHLLTLSALSFVDWLPPTVYRAAHRQVRLWWQGGVARVADPHLLVTGAGAWLGPEEDAWYRVVDCVQAVPPVRYEVVRLLPELQRLMHAFVGRDR
jgi:hypothetical protein